MPELIEKLLKNRITLLIYLSACYAQACKIITILLILLILSKKDCRLITYFFPPGKGNLLPRIFMKFSIILAVAPQITSPLYS